MLQRRVDPPSLDLTSVLDVDEAPTAQPSRRMTRIHTASRQAPKIQYIQGDFLGAGTYGAVWEATDLHTGQRLAVKRVKTTSMDAKARTYLKREVETLARVSHPHIVEYIAAQSPPQQPFEIITERKDGNVEYLVDKKVFQQVPAVANNLLSHMLQALDYLSSEDIIHRDVKPANILCTTPAPGCYHFQLADFGLCNTSRDAQTCAGTPRFAAPELVSGDHRQTPKMDIWSLLVTILEVLNVSGIRSKPHQTPDQLVTRVQDCLEDTIGQQLSAMAAIEPDKRASAADMLDQLYNGVGRTTRRPRSEDVKLRTHGRREDVVEPADQAMGVGMPDQIYKGAARTAKGLRSGDVNVCAQPPQEGMGIASFLKANQPGRRKTGKQPLANRGKTSKQSPANRLKTAMPAAPFADDIARRPVTRATIKRSRF